MSTEPAAWPEGYGLRILEEVDSTNAEAARTVQHLTAPTWILGLRQTAAKGRRGRAWLDPAGNFAATLVLFPEGPLRLAALRSFVAALALHDALVAITGRPEGFALKWPNDVLLNGGKLAGILLETASPSRRPGPLFIGMGVNLLDIPAADAMEPGAVAPTSLLSGTGARVTPQELLAVLGPAFALWEERLATSGFGPLRDAFLSRAARLGEPITARTGHSETTGIFEGIDDAGALVLVKAQGRITIPAAEIHF